MERKAEDGVRRPAGLWLLTIALLASAALHGLALLLHAHWLNFGSPHPWDSFVYFVIAPIVGALMLRRHERARFSVYVFLSCEIPREIRIHSGPLGLLAAGSILYLQLPAPRRFHPAVDPAKVMARLRLIGRRGDGGGRDSRGGSTTLRFLNHESASHLRMNRAVDPRCADSVHREQAFAAGRESSGCRKLRQGRRVGDDVVLHGVDVPPPQPLPFVDDDRLVAECRGTEADRARQDIGVRRWSLGRRRRRGRGRRAPPRPREHAT